MNQEALNLHATSSNSLKSHFRQKRFLHSRPLLISDRKDFSRFFPLFFSSSLPHILFLFTIITLIKFFLAAFCTLPVLGTEELSCVCVDKNDLSFNETNDDILKQTPKIQELQFSK